LTSLTSAPERRLAWP